LNEAENNSSPFNAVAIRANLNLKEEAYMQPENDELDIYLEPMVEVNDDTNVSQSQEILVCNHDC